MWKYVKSWESVVKVEKVWESMLKVEKIWECVLKVEKVCYTGSNGLFCQSPKNSIDITHLLTRDHMT